MALQKTISMNGADVSYWRIYRQDENFSLGLTVVRLMGYVNKDVRDEDVNSNLDSRVFSFESVDMTRVDVYDAIKAITTPGLDENGDPIEVPGEFSDSIDVFE